MYLRGSLTLSVLPLAIAQTLIWAATYYSFPALLPVWEADLGWSRSEVSMAFTIALIATALLAPRAGRVIDAGHAPAMLLGGIAIGAVLLVILSQVEALWQFQAVWLALGVVNAGILYEACFAIITVTTGARARHGITVVTLVAGFAGTVCFPAFYVLTEWMGWRTALQAFAGVTLLVSLPLTWWGLRLIEAHRAPPAERPPATGGEARSALRNPAFWGLALGFGATGLTHGMIIAHIRPILAECGLAEVNAVLVASLIGPMQVLGRVIVVSLGARVTTFGVAMGCFAGMFVGVIALISSGMAPWLAFAFVVPYGAAWGIISIVRPVLTADFLGRAAFGRLSGMVAVPYTLGAAIGPILAAKLWSFGGYDLVLGLSLALVALGGLLQFATRPRGLPYV
jgi:MFS family permease